MALGCRTPSYPMLPVLLWALLAPIALPGSARAQAVQNCQPNQYLDRTAADADRALSWDFSILSDPEKCLQVQAGQTVVWNGDLNDHPLAAQGGDTPNPISAHQDGSVTFDTPGTFGYFCVAHTSMRGAIKVVPAPAPAASVPALSAQLAVTLAALLLAGALLVLRSHRGRASAKG